MPGDPIMVEVELLADETIVIVADGVRPVGPEPEDEPVEMPTVKGNHDEYCSIDDATEGFNPHAAQAVIWTREQLSDDDRDWLRNLKYFRLATIFSIVPTV